MVDEPATRGSRGCRQRPSDRLSSCCFFYFLREQTQSNNQLNYTDDSSTTHQPDIFLLLELLALRTSIRALVLVLTGARPLFPHSAFARASRSIKQRESSNVCWDFSKLSCGSSCLRAASWLYDARGRIIFRHHVPCTWYILRIHSTTDEVGTGRRACRPIFDFSCPLLRSHRKPHRRAAVQRAPLSSRRLDPTALLPRSVSFRTCPFALSLLLLLLLPLAARAYFRVEPAVAVCCVRVLVLPCCTHERTRT